MSVTYHQHSGTVSVSEHINMTALSPLSQHYSNEIKQRTQITQMER